MKLDEFFGLFRGFNYIDRIYKNQKVKKYAEILTSTKLNISKYVGTLQNDHRTLTEVTSANLTTNELTTIIENSKKLLQESYNDKIEKLNALLRFRKINKIETAANYPKSKILFWGLLFIVLILESMANAYFYAQGSDLGLLGGVLQAFLVSLANVVISFGIGFILFRYTNHISKFKKIIAWVGIILSFFIISFLHLMAAHYREILLKYPDDNIKNVIQETYNNPFNLSDFDSFILIIIGYFITILVVFKSYHYDDRYPHHGKMEREYKLTKIKIEGIIDKNNKTFSNAKSTLIEQITTLGKKDLNKPNHVIQKNLDTLIEARNNLNTLIEKLREKSLNYVKIFRNQYNQNIISDNKFEINKNINNRILEKIRV